MNPQTPQIIIDPQVHRQIGIGFSAHIFEVAGKAYKLFLRGPDVPPRHTEEGRRLRYQAQCEAYKLASSDLLLKDHIATFYGSCLVQDVLSDAGVSIVETYLLDCCYALELLSGTEMKLTAPEIRDNRKYLQDAEMRFAELGIDVLDATVFNFHDPNGFKFVDFEIRNWY